MMVKEDPTKIGEEEKIGKEADQETVGHSTCPSTALNREAIQFKFLIGLQVCQQGPNDSPSWPITAIKPKQDSSFLF